MSEHHNLVYSVGGKANKFEIQYVFHDEHCLHLRKYKEAIRNYVFNEELQRAKPYKKKLIPNVYDKYRVLEMFGEKDLVLSMEHGVELERPSKRKLNLRRQRKLAQHHLYRSVLCEYKSIQLQIHSNNSDLMMNECIVSIDNHRMDRAFEDAMDYRILKYIDYELYGFCLWTFIISELEMKDRFSLWIILRLIISKLSTSSTIKLFHKTRTSLVRFDRIHLKHLCLTAIEKSTFPAQTALYLSGEFSAELSELIPLFTSIAIFDREQQQNQKETRDVIQNTMSCDTPQRTPAFMTQTDGVESLFKLKRRYSQRKNEKHTQEEANGNSNDNEDTDTDVSVVADAILKNG
eukprot:975826_1